jgi:hypothetical protein
VNFEFLNSQFHPAQIVFKCLGGLRLKIFPRMIIPYDGIQKPGVELYVHLSSVIFITHQSTCLVGKAEKPFGIYPNLPTEFAYPKKNAY